LEVKEQKGDLSSSKKELTIKNRRSKIHQKRTSFFLKNDRIA
jgi:hypothetical protein